MPDNNQVALGINTSGPDLGKSLGIVSQFNAANAMAGLRDIQALQQQRQYSALQAAADAYRSKNDPVGAYLAAGGDPTGAGQLQNVFAGQKAMGVTPGGLLPEAYSHLTSAEKSLAETRKIGVETSAAGTDFGAKIAQGVIADPSNDSVWQNAVNQHYQTAGGSPLEKQQYLSIKDPAQRLQIAKTYAAQGVSPNTYGTPHNVPVTDAVTTPGASYAVPQPVQRGGPLPPASQQGGMIGAPGERIMGGGVVSDNGVPMPNQQVANRFGTMAPAMTPGQAAETKAYGETIAKVLPTLAEKADQSRQANFTLDQMRQESQTWDMGKGASTLMTAQQYLKPLANALGSTVFDKPVADFESFQKNTGTLVRQAVKEVSSRAAVQEFNLIQGQLPSASMTRQGFNQIADQFQAVNDFNIAKHQAGQAWMDATGSMNKFETEWNKNITPAAFLVSRLPPEQLGALKANLERTPQGRSTLKSLTTQLQWAHDHNLDALVQ